MALWSLAAFTRRVAALGCGALAITALVSASAVSAACAEGASADPDGFGDLDAASLEASAGGRPKDGGAGSDSGRPEEDDAGTDGTDGGTSGNAACLAALDKAKFDFEANDQGWTHKTSDNAQGGPAWPYDPWSYGAALSLACPAGKCWAAERTQNYAQCQRGELVSPRIDLSACAGKNIVLSFSHAYAFWSGSYGGQTWFDGGIVELSMDDGSSWQQPAATFPGTVKINPNRTSTYQCHMSTQFRVHNKAGFTGTQNTPSTFTIAVPANYLSDKLRVRFSQASGVSSSTTNAETSRSATGAGWRIDNVKFDMQ